MRSKENHERMLDLVGQWEESGLSQKDFVTVKGIKVHTFQYWITKMRRMAEGIRVKLRKPIPITGSDLVFYAYRRCNIF